MGRAKRLRIERLHQKLYQIRKSLNITQAELTKRLGFEKIIYPNNVSEYESGKREPPLPIILAYARLAEISTDFLIDDDLDLPA